MIVLPPREDASNAEWYAVELLVDLSRVVRMDDAAADVVRLEMSDRVAPDASLRATIAGNWFIDVADGVVRIPRLALRHIVDVAGAAVEQGSDLRDRHGRVPAEGNPLVAIGAERDPVVSRAAMLLRAAVVKAAGRRCVRLVPAWPNDHRWAAAFTHDIDVVSWWPLFAALRILELAKKRRIGLAARVTASAAWSSFRSPVERGLRETFEAEGDGAIPSTWFLLCGQPTLESMRTGDITYDATSPRVRRIIARILERGGEIGLHGSLATVTDDEQFAAQRARLERLAGSRVSGVRQHFLRMHPGATQSLMHAAGFAYDATYGFADRSGFRLGVADIIPAWSARDDRPINLDEVPLTWMDRAASKYQGVQEPSAWARDAIELADSCRAVEGLWVGLWHPNLTTPLGFPDAADAYAHIVQEIVKRAPYVATVEQCVTWRRRRRAVRATAIGADGSVSSRSTPGDEAIRLVDGMSDAREAVASE